MFTDKPIRTTITKEQFESLQPFDKMSHKATELTGLCGEDYWFEVVFEVTRDCPRYGYAVLVANKR